MTIMNEKTTHNLINRYFDGDTTLQQERMLRQMLSQLDSPDELEREAMAVMGFSAAATVSSPKRSSVSRSSIFRAAASIILLITAATALLTHTLPENHDRCVAYVDGQRISDTEEIHRLMMLNLSEMAEASENLDNEVALTLNDLSDFINE